ncbi:flagellar export chaperone FliS [Acetivibrio cellulolyticus]|uniref:flagellar export chaperone FliS n=1 Tax=Acetivibrio cellulolyticus TaxID=35830 RepID=UPI0001E2E343|nr:flagellar export chaperone FliS [Acetivibrio cellulolyticus]
MAINNAYDQYKENSVYTASPEELTLMLYNGLVKFLMQSQMGINEKNIEKANNCIIKAQNIISEFRCTLDMKYEISKQLELIYDYMNRRLIEANIKKDVTIVEEILGYARELRNTWEQAMKIARQQNAGASQIAK